MLDTLRQGASGWLAKFLMGLLVLSFVGWGIVTRQVGTTGAGQTLLQVGGQNVTTDQYQRLFGTELRKVELQAHQAIPVQTAHQLGLDRQVFSGLLVDAQARQLNLGISDKAITDKLAGQKNLQNTDGSFDKDAFRYLLQNLGMTEGGYLDMLRSDTVREQLLGTVSAVAPPPQILLDALNQFQGEERSIDYFLVPIAKVPAPAKPDDAKLKAYYELHKDQYRAPEYRTVGLLLASPDDIKSTMSVSDDEVKAAYEATKDSYGKPEMRHVQIMSFRDKPSADKAMAEIKTGKDFMAVAKDMGLAIKDVDRGLITKSGLLDTVAADAAFKLEKDKVSDPVEGALATSIIRVTEIQPSSMKSLDDVKGEIKDRLARDKAVKALIDLRGKVEDARGGGAQLKEIPAKFPFKYTELPAMDKEGKGADGKPASTIPDLPAVLKAGFASDVGVETDPVDLGKDGWAWVEVKTVKPARQKTLDEVKAQIETAYTDNETQSGLTKLTQDFVDRANKGEDFAKLAAEAGDTVKSAAGLVRRGQNPNLPPATSQLAFSLAKGATGNLSATDNKARLVFKVTGITPAKPLDDATRKQLTEQIAQQMAGIATAQYLAGLEKTVGFSLDQAQFNQMVGAGTGNDQQPEE